MNADDYICWGFGKFYETDWYLLEPDTIGNLVEIPWASPMLAS